MTKSLYIGNQPFRGPAGPVAGKLVIMEGEDFYRIENCDRLRPFFMSIVSSSDHWLFISSNGALTAGRGNPDNALFPYDTEDKIHDSEETTGSKTILIVEQGKRSRLWEPFSERNRGAYRIQRNIYKNLVGNKLVFEETNADLSLTFRYGWFTSDRFGLVRRVWLISNGNQPIHISLLDGLQNLMPCGSNSQFQLEKSTLLDAYKRNELLPETGLGLFRLSSIPIDRPEPAEALRTTTVWSIGLEPSLKLLSSVQLAAFRRGETICQETDVRAERGAYLIQAELQMTPDQPREWLLVADVNRGPAEVAELNQRLRRPARLRSLVLADIAKGTDELRQIVASADGLQKTARALGDARHFNNVLFNVMRGGVFTDNYRVDTADLQQTVQRANRDVAARHDAFFGDLGARNHQSHVIARAVATGDAQLERLCREYLPLTFSRRHGDPSRPWNRFSIVTRNPDGTRTLNYEGNWRDIFQNWEALALSFPGYVSSMICRFVNASTADGYNPYRISREGFDWEVVNPHDPWAHIGYWGDHQIIYLLKLLEILQQHEPATLREFMTRDLFTYANVPYRIKPYPRLIENPKETVDFDQHTDELTRQRVASRGTDGKLIWDRKGRVKQVNLTEKLLVSVLGKLANLIPEAGIWMNTQRPEWNDANNALVGFGVSMVTLYYLRRYVAFCREIFRSMATTELSLSKEVGQLLQSTNRILRTHRRLLNQLLSDKDRRRVLDALGLAGSRYRQRIYKTGFSGQRVLVPATRMKTFCDLALEWLEHSIRANRRGDGLYHAYNLIKLDRKKEIPIRHLGPMLEGQVAILSSGCLSCEESVSVLSALKQSSMYRADQHSYLLYPDRNLPRFVDRNIIPPGGVAQSALLKKLVADSNQELVECDVRRRFHFHGTITNANDIRRILKHLAATGYAPLVARDAQLVLDLFEELFDHQSFTGRSGTFFGYEGLGCIYWHMISKLLLVTQETLNRATREAAPESVRQQLADGYQDIRRGIGDFKSPEGYGAFPMDPYSHTPAHAGARQPGLTGQVKEDILCRFGELGVFVREGRIHFQPQALSRVEFLTQPSDFIFIAPSGLRRRLRLKAGSLGFSYCQVPVIYQLDRESAITLVRRNGAEKVVKDTCLDEETSRSIFQRRDEIAQITVSVVVA